MVNWIGLVAPLIDFGGTDGGLDLFDVRRSRC